MLSEPEVESEDDCEDSGFGNTGAAFDFCDALISRSLMDDALRQAYDWAARVTQERGEDETEYYDWVSKAARMCRWAVTMSEVVNHFLQGLKHSVLVGISQTCRNISEAAKFSIEVVPDVEV